MAVTSVWAVRKRLDHVLDYAMNPDKTSPHARHDDLGNVLSYTTRDEKAQYVTGINCLPESAREQMHMTKLAWNKPGGVLAVHGYQSFKPGETTPEQAHAIGVEFARRMWGGRFQVVVATHTDQEHSQLTAMPDYDPATIYPCYKLVVDGTLIYVLYASHNYARQTLARCQG